LSEHPRPGRGSCHARPPDEGGVGRRCLSDARLGRGCSTRPSASRYSLRPPAGCGSPSRASCSWRSALPPPRIQGRGVAGQPVAQVGDDPAEPPDHVIEAGVHRGQVGGVAQGVEEPREVPMVGDLLLGLDADEAAGRRVAAQFGQARLVRGMAKQEGASWGKGIWPPPPRPGEKASG
jgi:hypothetical protein